MVSWTNSLRRTIAACGSPRSVGLTRGVQKVAVNGGARGGKRQLDEFARSTSLAGGSSWKALLLEEGNMADQILGLYGDEEQWWRPTTVD
jgi:hypothetical protein